MSALQEVADTLNVTQTDSGALDKTELAAQSASAAGEQALKRYEAGAIDFSALRVAQQNEHLANIYLAQAKVNRLGDAVALFQALSGRWWKYEETDKTKAVQP